ncbi:protein Wiz isoform X2 [Xyrichtys novacula]|uniref:Protein Wiz isoform X2 n=1 Tax=Xyrichtys novacula TaxID=13765 RepID=A0AAV1GU97_XYRNO|nr:protein Wiz isoform X2 [Xyrichtys novacula]
MEPEGRPLTPGTSYGPPSFDSAQNPDTFLSCTLQSSCSRDVSDGLMSPKCSWTPAEDVGPKQTEGTDPGRSAQRRFRSSAFPSSLSWDSDSEKETLDEEELQHFSNPHGLAAHSPGSPSSGLRLDSEEDREPEKWKLLRSETDSPAPNEGHHHINNESTKTDEPNTSQPGPTELSDSKVWNVTEGAELFLSKVKPKEGCQTDREKEEADNSEDEKRPKGKETKEPERDVYSFPGDSDPESPPPAPWAHCTFIQRCRKKRVLLRPFSGLGTLKRTSPVSGKRARASPQKPKPADPAQLDGSGGVYDFEEVDFDELDEPIKFRDKGVKRDKEGSSKEIFTCVECSIYFKKQEHLREHIVEHCENGPDGGRRSGKGGRFQCVECGWSLSDRLALADHHKRHEESRLKILEEIKKLNENETEEVDAKLAKHMSPDSDIKQDAGPASIPGKMSDPEIVSSAPLSPTPGADPVVLDSDATPLSSVRSPPQACAVSGNRRRFICTKCNFSTRTPQALANHTKTHNRKKPPQSNSPSSGSPSCSRSDTLSCGHCAFKTSSQSVMREHQKLVHQGPASISGVQTNETGQHLRSNVATRVSKPSPDPEHLSETDAAQSKGQQGLTSPEDGDAARPSSRMVFRCGKNRRFSRRGKIWTNQVKFHSMENEEEPPRSEEEQERDQSTALEIESPQREADSPVEGKSNTRVQSNTDDGSAQQSPTLSLPPEKSVKDEDAPEDEKDAKVFFLRRSNRVTAASAEIDSDDDEYDIDEEHVRRLLSEGILDEDNDKIDEDTETLKSVERKCPYCPDRFHNGIGLANHVRGHLNRVGVSYNVRHFISPEEVNAIEKKFSYQKKKKKANFDPDTFSVMHCEFCSAGFDTRAGLSSHARAHLRDFGITNWDVTISPIHILRELFSSRPDLVIPTAPPKEEGEEEEDDDEEEEDEEGEEEREAEEGRKGVIEVKLEGETSERMLSAAVTDALPSASPQHCKKEDVEEESEGEEEETNEEEDEEPDGLSRGKTGLCRVDTDSPSPGEDADTKVHKLKCEVCGARFETKRGLSIHARYHLRQLGIGVSEQSGAAITLLHQIAKERNLNREPPAAKTSSPSDPQKDEVVDDMDLDEKPIPLSILAKAAKSAPPSSSSTPTPSPGASPAPPHSGSPPSVVRKAPISSLLPVSSPLRSLEHKAGGMKSLTSNLSSSITTSKPLWAPQEDDAPLNLTLEVDANKDIVCQLCGAWFETRKGLSSHARAHLRHFGVEYSESKGSPIDLLNQLMDSDDFKHKAGSLQLDDHTEPRGLNSTLSSHKQSSLLNLSSSSSSSSSLLYKVTTASGGSTSKATSSSASSLLGPPAKRLKSSSMRVFRLSSGELMALPHNEPPKEIGCEFCGEYFENRKGLSSHARSHLRQMGITEWSVNGSPIDTLREIITRRGLPRALPPKPLKTPPSSSPGPPRSPVSASSSPSSSLISRLPFAFARPSSPPQPAVSKSSPAPLTSSSGLILKLKPEPVQLEVTAPGAVGRSAGRSSETLTWNSSDSMFPLNLAMTNEVEPTRDIRCEFCGEYFENRKGLSSHARSHLRQMGITEWSVNGSPIDTLREVMHKRGAGPSSLSDQGVKKESNPGASSPPWESYGSSEGLSASSFQSKYRKSPLSLLQSGSRLHKQGLGSVGTSATLSGGKFFRMSPLGKRPLSEGGQSVDTGHSSPHHLKTFSSVPHDFSYKRKPSPDKHGHQDPSCELCGFYFENRKALASHARAHLRQFGVTEWCVNGSPIETLSAWMRSRPQKVLEMHRSYMQGSRSTLKKKPSSSWSSSLAVGLVRPLSREVSHGSSKTTDGDSGNSLLGDPVRSGRSSPSPSRLAGGVPLQAQVARSELNVRLPRGFERRPLKHPSLSEGTERDSGPPKPLRTSTIPALVPKPPSYPLVKLVGKFYTLKCRFCEVEFHGPLSVQEDWIRHLQQHILKMNYNKPAAPKEPSAGPPAPVEDPAQLQASTSTSSTTSTLTRTSPPNSSSPTPPSEPAPPLTATKIVKVSEERSTPSPAPIPLPAQTV